MEELNTKINNIIEEFERHNKCKLKISIYNGDKTNGSYEYEGDKLLLEKMKMAEDSWANTHNEFIDNETLVSDCCAVEQEKSLTHCPNCNDPCEWINI